MVGGECLGGNEEGSLKCYPGKKKSGKGGGCNHKKERTARTERIHMPTTVSGGAARSFQRGKEERGRAGERQRGFAGVGMGTRLKGGRRPVRGGKTKGRSVNHRLSLAAEPQSCRIPHCHNHPKHVS